MGNTLSAESDSHARRRKEGKEANGIARKDCTVVRNSSYKKTNFALRERHNERKNEEYANPDIIPERSKLNVHFKRCEGTYAQAFDKLLEDGIISTRGLKPDADVFCEFVFDVNTAYFEENGGYDFARDFFEEAYRIAVKEAGDERYVLSAVLHADERNRGLSEALGYDVFHYHLHVVYIPVVEKEILWSKRCKDEALRGMVREIIHQVSRSKKWAYPEAVDEQGKPILGKNGKPIRIPSYSLLQDRFYEHMRLAGFDGFESGELGSTRVNLNSLDFKIQEDKKRLMQLEKLVAAKEMKLEQVSEKLVAQKQVNKQYHDLDGIGKKTVFGKIELTEKDYTDVISLAREGILSRVKISELTQKLQDAGARILDLQSSWERLYEQTKDFRQAVKLAPQRVKEVFTEIFAKDHETRELQRILRRSAKKRNEYER
mgnify:FL=1